MAVNWVAPDPPAPPHPRNCHDRAAHNPVYTNPCAAGRSNCTGNPINPPGAHAPHDHHGVCKWCRDHGRTRRWYVAMENRFLRLSPADEMIAIPRRTNTLTRLCGTCEMSEQMRIIKSSNGPGQMLTWVHPTQMEQDRMANYPTNTCTCLHRVDPSRYCWGHSKAKWDYERDAVNAELQNNRSILYRWKMATLANGTRQMATAHEDRLVDRIVRGTIKACRCGEEVDNSRSKVHMCIICEGFVQQIHRPFNRTPPYSLRLSQDHLSIGFAFGLAAQEGNRLLNHLVR